MITVRLILMVLAVVCLALAAGGLAARVNLVALGLALWALSTIVPV
jgi:hypothetical protein